MLTVMLTCSQQILSSITQGVNQTLKPYASLENYWAELIAFLKLPDTAFLLSCNKDL